jgi:hypothetical protein
LPTNRQPRGRTSDACVHRTLEDAATGAAIRRGGGSATGACDIVNAAFTDDASSMAASFPFRVARDRPAL